VRGLLAFEKGVPTAVEDGQVGDSLKISRVVLHNDAPVETALQLFDQVRLKTVFQLHGTAPCLGSENIKGKDKPFLP